MLGSTDWKVMHEAGSLVGRTAKLRAAQAESGRLHMVLDEWRRRANAAEKVRDGFTSLGSERYAELAEALRREILRCHDELRDAMYPVVGR